MMKLDIKSYKLLIQIIPEIVANRVRNLINAMLQTNLFVSLVQSEFRIPIEREKRRNGFSISCELVLD